LTLTPANHSTLVEPISLSKTATTAEDEALIKSVLHLAQDNVPSFIDISKRVSETKVTENVSTIRKLVKALTAGYGGGAPTSRVGGSVLQPESVGKDEGKFKYITCDDCGKESIYMKYQTKCRNCGKSFPMLKLAKFFLKA
jgi:ribosomal protein S27E